MNRGAWRSAVRGVTKSQTRLSSHPTQSTPISSSFSCLETFGPARITRGFLVPPESQPDHFPCNSPQSSLHPPLHLLHIRFLPPTVDFTLSLCPFLIPSCLRNSLYLPLPHHVFGVSFSEILGNSDFCHSTGLSFLLSLFPAPSSLKGSSQCVVVSSTLKAPPPPQDLTLFSTLLLLLVSVMMTTQVSSSRAQSFISPMHMAPFLIHISQLSGYPEV